MSKCDTIITFDDFKEDEIFGNDWGLFVDLDEDTVKPKETYEFLDLELENTLYTDLNFKKNTYFDYFCESLKIAVVMIISTILFL